LYRIYTLSATSLCRDNKAKVFLKKKTLKKERKIKIKIFGTCGDRTVNRSH